MGHGVGVRTIDATQAVPPSASQNGIDPKFFSGFSFLLGDPAPEQRSRWGDDLPAARKLFFTLAAALPDNVTSRAARCGRGSAAPSR